MKLEEINKRMLEIKSEIESDNADLDALDKELDELKEKRKSVLDKAEKRKTLIDSVTNMTEANVVKEFKENKEERSVEITKENIFDSKEYRAAFMNYCKTGVMPVEYRAGDAYTSAAEAAAMIPTTIMNEIVDKMSSYGNLFAKVRKLNVKGGVNFPILSLKPTASWITEATPSDRQEVNVNTSVSFSYFGLEVKIATSLLADAATLTTFESLMSTLVAEAMSKALDGAIISGVGTTQPVGITADTRVPAGQIVTLSSSDFLDYSAWKKKVMAKIPVSYRAKGSWIMAAETFEGYIDGMVDANGQPVGRVNFGITDGPQERFNGKEVILVEDDIVEPYSTASNGEVVAIFCNLQDYAINSNLQMQVYRWLDQDKNQYVDKAILIADGKLIDPNGVVIVKKGA